MQAYTPSQPPTLPKRNKFWPSDFWEIRANFYRTLQIFKIQCDESTCELISLFQSISLALKKIAFFVTRLTSIAVGIDRKQRWPQVK